LPQGTLSLELELVGVPTGRTITGLKTKAGGLRKNASLDAVQQAGEYNNVIKLRKNSKLRFQ